MLNELSTLETIKIISKYSLKEINVALQKLKPIFRTIIKKIIFEQDNIWWVDYYSKSSYYRLRRRAFISLSLFLLVTK